MLCWRVQRYKHDNVVPDGTQSLFHFFGMSDLSCLSSNVQMNSIPIEFVCTRDIMLPHLHETQSGQRILDQCG